MHTLVIECNTIKSRNALVYKTEALIFKMDTPRFLNVFEEGTNKIKENAIALIIT